MEKPVAHHFLSCILEASVPVCAAISFFKSPTVSSGLHLTRTGECTKNQLVTGKSNSESTVTHLCDLDDRWR